MGEERMEMYEFRAVYVGAGPLAAAVIKEEFAPFAVDVETISGPATPEFARNIADTNSNFAIIPFDLGYPPAKQESQHDFFRRITELLAEEGVETLALITPSTFAPVDEFRNARWTARRPGGRSAPYSRMSSRLMACWLSGEWRESMAGAVAAAVDAGAGGVFLDALCFGSAPVLIGEKYSGPAGCHCPACAEKYSGEGGRIPKNLLQPDSENTIRFIEWRAAVASAFLLFLQSGLKEKDDSAVFAVNVPHIATLPVKPMFGIDPLWILDNADVACMEHCRAPMLKQSGLTYESPALKVLRSSAKNALPAALGYAYGPAPDAAHAPKYYAFTAASGFSCGVVPVARFGEYRDRPGKDELVGDYLSGGQRAEQRDTLALMNNWLEKNSDIYEGAEPAARVGILFSWKHSAGPNGPRMLRIFYTIIQTLTELQIPVKPVIAEELAGMAADELRVVISPFTGVQPGEFSQWAKEEGAEAQLVFTGDIPPEFEMEKCSTLPPDVFKEKRTPMAGFLHSGAGARLLGRMYGGSPGIYGGFPLSRRAGLPPLFLNKVPSSFMRCQPPDRWKELHETVKAALAKFPEDVTIEAPPYIHVFETKKPPDSYFHIVNIAPGFPGPDACLLKFSSPVSARILLPGSNKTVYSNNEKSIAVKPEPYTVVNVKNRY